MEKCFKRADCKLNVVEVSCLPKLIYKVNAISVKGLVIPECYFMGTKKVILMFLWKGKRPRRANIILKKNQVEGSTLATVMKIV